ncbi:MAG: hypothetical protein QM687_09140 [Ferruginibacter sp.]
MQPDSTATEIIEENAAYVLGMYDLYQFDGEIIQSLRMKGLPEWMIQQVMIRVKKPAYEKRVRQAKRMIRVGLLLICALFVIPALIVYFTGFRFPEITDNNRDYMFEAFFGYYRDLYFLILVLVLIQTIAGFVRLNKYGKLLRQYSE